MADQKDSKTLEMRIAELEDKLSKVTLSEQEVAALKGLAAMGTMAHAQPLTCSCIVHQCITQCIIVQCLIHQCWIQQCIRQCFECSCGPCAPTPTAGMGGIGGFGMLGR